MKKKLLAGLLTATMVMGMSLTTFAADGAEIKVNGASNAELNYVQVIEPDRTEVTGWDFSSEEIAEVGVRAAKMGLGVNVHGIGDEAISGTLAMAKAIREAGYDDCRITNSHCDYVKDHELELFGKYNVIANTTCVWHYGNPDMEKVIGDRQNRTFRLKTMIDGGCRMGLGSDFPVDEFGREPLKGIEMGCSRQLFDHPELPVLKPFEEKLSVEDGIKGYTVNNAYQMHMEDKLGTIEEGKYADLVILEKNIFEIPVSEIHKVKVCETISDGKTIYKA